MFTPHLSLNLSILDRELNHLALLKVDGASYIWIDRRLSAVSPCSTSFIFYISIAFNEPGTQSQFTEC